MNTTGVYADDAVTESIYEATLHITQASPAVGICGVILGIICMSSAIFGNGLLIAVVLRDKRLRQRQNFFMVSMATCELLMVCFRDSLVLATYGFTRWPFGSSTAAALGILEIMRNAMTVGHIAAITIYRYALIVHRKAFRVISKTPFLIFVQLLLILFPLGSGIGSSSGLFSEIYYYNTKGMRPITAQKLGEGVGYYHVPEEEQSTDVIVIVFAYLLVNVAILAGCYVHIYVFIERSKKRLQVWTTSNSEQNATASKQSKAANNKDVKFVKTMAIVFVTFVLAYFWTPIISSVDTTFSWSHWVYFPFVMLNWFSSSINWIVSALTHPAFNQGFRKILHLKPKKVGNFENTSQTNGTNAY